MSRTYIFVFLLGLSGVNALASEPRAITVTGSCHQEATPDRGSIILTSVVVDKDLKAAARKAGERYERVREAVKRLGLEDLEVRTTEYQLHELKEWEKDRQVSKGFQCRMGIRVETSNLQRLGEVIAIGAREGIEESGQLQAFLSTAKQKSVRLSCLKDAALDARAKAEKLADALGAKLGDVISITEGGADAPAPPRPQLEAMSMRSSKDMAPPSIEPGREEISASVQVSFNVK